MAEMAKTAAMYNVTIIINPDKLVPLKAALNDLGIQGITVTHVEGCGTQHGGVAGSGIAPICPLAPSGIADGHRTVHMEDSLLQHPLQFGIAGRSQHRHAGDAV